MHYYFRTKEPLFQAIFGDILMSFLPAVSDTISSDLPLEEKLERITDKYLTILNDNPSLPLFFINETQRDLEGFVKMAMSNDVVRHMMLLHSPDNEQINNFSYGKERRCKEDV